MRTVYEQEKKVTGGAVITLNTIDAKDLSELEVLVDNSDASSVTDRDLSISLLAKDGTTPLFQAKVTVLQKTWKAILLSSRIQQSGSLTLSGTGAARASGTITLSTSLAAAEKVTINGHDLVFRAKYATATVAFSTIVADNAVTIGGQAFTAKLAPSGAAEFALGAGDAEALTNLAAKVNAHPTVGLLVQMNGSTGVVTAVAAGATGNAITITKTGDPITITGDSGGKLSGAYDASLNEVPVEATLTLSAAALAAQINASSTAGLVGCVSATSDGAVVTVSAAATGLLGNLVTLAKTGTHIAVSGSGTLTGGTAGTDAT